MKKSGKKLGLCFLGLGAFYAAFYLGFGIYLHCMNFPTGLRGPSGFEIAKFAKAEEFDFDSASLDSHSYKMEKIKYAAKAIGLVSNQDVSSFSVTASGQEGAGTLTFKGVEVQEITYYDSLAKADDEKKTERMYFASFPIDHFKIDGYTITLENGGEQPGVKAKVLFLCY